MSAGDPALLEVNQRLSDWAIDGILATQARVGATHDTSLRESEATALAVSALNKAVESGVCQRRADGSTYMLIRSTGETELTLLRQDGTSLVFSMLLGMYLKRGQMYPGWRVIELAGEQWRAGRTAMYEVLGRIGKEELSATTEGIFFGMVKSGTQVMQSRKGIMVLADSLIESVADRVCDWKQCPEGLRWDRTAQARLAVALLKYHILRFPRSEGFSFDQEAMWLDATKRCGAVLRALTWAQSMGKTPSAGLKDNPEERSLALAIALHSTTARQALEKRDPAILVRYIDDLTRKTLIMARQDALTSAMHAVVFLVLRQSLSLLGIDEIDLALPKK